MVFLDGLDLLVFVGILSSKFYHQESLDVMKVKLADGNLFEISSGASAKDLAATLSRSLAKTAVVAKINGTLKDLSTLLQEDDQIVFLSAKDTEALEVLRYSAAHLMADGILRLFPKLS